MDQQRSGVHEAKDIGPSRPLRTLATYGAAGTIVVLGGAAAYLLMRAGPEALAATSRALIVTGLTGLLPIALISMRLYRTSRDSGDHGGGAQPPEPGPTPPMDDVDAELFRMISDEQLRDLRATPQQPASLSADVRARIRRGSPC